MSEQAPYVGAMVHFMAGDLDCAAVITHLDFRVSLPPDDPQLSLPIVMPPIQALLVLSAMQQPFWTVAGYSAGAEVGTWHWPSLHDPPEVEPPKAEAPIYVGEIVHYSEGTTTHLAACVINIANRSGGLLDLAVFNNVKKRTDYVYNVPRDQAGFGNATWHRIWFVSIPEPHEDGPAAPVGAPVELYTEEINADASS